MVRVPGEPPDTSQLVSLQTFIFTDGDDPELQRQGGSHVINTNCSAVHTRQALCCKMSVEYDKFIESGRKYVVPSSAPSESPGLRLGPHTWAAPLRETCSLPAGGSATWMMTTT